MIAGFLMLAFGIGMSWAQRKARREYPHWYPPKPLFAIDYGLGPGKILEHLHELMPIPAMTPTTVAEVAPDHVFFKDGEPTTFDAYDGQEHIVSYLRDAVRGLGHDEEAIAPQMFLGMAGLGKTLLAKVVANELKLRAEQLGLEPPRFFEWFPADIPDVARLDQLIHEVSAQPSVVFIDEIHELKESHTLKLYLVLEEGRYKYAGDTQPVELPPITLLGATTDWGQVHGALKRRWQTHQLKPASEAQLVKYVLNRVPITDSAAQLIVSRTKFSGAPWEAIQIGQMAYVSAKGRGATTIEDPDVERVFVQQEIDEHGLRWQDRNVMRVLFTQPRYRIIKKTPTFIAFAASEQNVVTLAGIDKAEYRESVRPRLMARGLLEIRATYGQSLTEKANELYGHLRRPVTIPTEET